MLLLSMLLLLLLPIDSVEKIRTDLPLNKAGKVSFEGAVAVEDMGKEALYRNALAYISGVKEVKDRSTKPEIDFARGLLARQGSFLVYKQGMLTPQPHGEIQYRVELVVEEGGYSYKYSDFVFQYYERNRYGRYEPVSGKTKALEEAEFKGMQALWQAHKKSTRRYIENHIKTLKARMLLEPPGVRLNEAPDAQQEDFN